MRIPFTDIVIIRQSEIDKIRAKERKLQIRLTDAQIDQFLEGKIHMRKSPGPRNKEVAA